MAPMESSLRKAFRGAVRSKASRGRFLVNGTCRRLGD